jgi:hypothetical protein
MYHIHRLGLQATSSNSDMDGYVPEDGDGPWDFTIDHGTEKTHDDDGNLTPYGEWWEDDGFDEWKEKVLEAK